MPELHSYTFAIYKQLDGHFILLVQTVKFPQLDMCHISVDTETLYFYLYKCQHSSGTQMPYASK